jgi:hypothetical protein
MRRRGRFVVSLALVLLSATAGVARATTGATIGFPAPKSTVPLEISEAFEGRYLMTGIGSGAQIRDGEMKLGISGVDLEGHPEGARIKFPVGGLQIAEYNPRGQIETALFSLYPFRLVPGGISGTVLSQGLRYKPVGKIELKTPGPGRRLTGRIWLHGGGPFRLEFRRLFENQSLESGRPPARMLKESSRSHRHPGWGAAAEEYAGEYELVDTAPDLTGEAALLGPVIRVAEGVGAAGRSPSGGSMLVTAGAAPAADVTIEAGGETETVHLRDLAWDGDLRTATVTGLSGKSADGEFRANEVGGHELVGTIDVGPFHYKVKFRRVQNEAPPDR